MPSRAAIRSGLFLSLAIAALLGSQASQAAGDPRRGADTFAQECAECHSVKEGKNKKGPSLFAVVGRRAGSIADFVYSEPMKQSAFNWTSDRIDAYIAHPKQVVPGGKMKYDGLADEKDRADLIAYLGTLR